MMAHDDDNERIRVLSTKIFNDLALIIGKEFLETPLHIFKKFPVTDFLSLHDWSSSKEATWGTTYNSVIFTYY